MTLLRQSEIPKWSFLVLWGLIAASDLPLLNYLSMPVVAIWLLFWLWRGVLFFRMNFQPPAWLTLLLAFATVIEQVVFHVSTDPIGFGVSMFVIAFSLKFIDFYRRQDIFSILCLQLILLGSLLVYNQAIFIAVYVAILLWFWLMLTVTIQSNIEQKLFDIHSKKTALMLIFALPLAGFLFVSFPRIDLPHWLSIKQQKTNVTGLSDTLDPSEFNQLIKSNQRVFRAHFEKQQPDAKSLYWRGVVFSLVNGSQWQALNNDHIQPRQDAIVYGETHYEYTQLLEPQSHNWIYPLEFPASNDPRLRLNAYYQLQRVDEFQGSAEFKLSARPDYNTGYITKLEYRQNLLLPNDVTKKIKELVIDLTSTSNDPAVIAETVMQYFAKGGFSYSLDPPKMGQYPIDQFLFTDKQGYCSHYAMAFVYLMRVANIPARLVGGYLGGEYNRVGQFWEIKQANAHLWAEIWLEDRGWVRFDPTSVVSVARSGVQSANRQLAQIGATQNLSQENSLEPTFSSSGLLQIWWNIDYQWHRWFVNFNGWTQSLLLSSLQLASGWPLILISSIGLALIGVRSMMISYQISRRTVHELKSYQIFLAKMNRYQLPLKVGEGPVDYAERITRLRPELADSVGRITSLFVELMYGRQPNPKCLKLLRSLVKQF